MKKETINSILRIKESIELPYRVKEILFSEEKNKIFDNFLEEESDLSYDWFNEYFQQEQADRRELKQDYTPKSICDILQEITPNAEWICDICSGSGSLTISMWNKNNYAIFQCEEISDRVFPLLLFNMAIRNMKGYAVKKDILSGEISEIYELIPNDKYSIINKIDSIPENKFNMVVMNPPYSLKCNTKQENLQEFEPLPTDKADWIFTLYGLKKMKPNGQLFAILPHGVLFRGAKEREIRKKIVEKKLLKTIIGLPDKLFMNTSIPVLIMELQDNSEAYIMDVTSYYIKKGRQNEITESQIEEIANIYKIRKNIEKTSKMTSLEEIKQNDYNLNIPRYIDKFEREELPPLSTVIKGLAEINRKIKEAEKDLLEQMEQMVGTDEQSDKDLKQAMEEYRKIVGGKK